MLASIACRPCLLKYSLAHDGLQSARPAVSTQSHTGRRHRIILSREYIKSSVVTHLPVVELSCRRE
jgi:hypothetical protein